MQVYNCHYANVLCGCNQKFLKRLLYFHSSSIQGHYKSFRSSLNEPLADAGQLLPSTVKKWNEIWPQVKWTLSLFFKILAQKPNLLLLIITDAKLFWPKKKLPSLYLPLDPGPPYNTLIVMLCILLKVFRRKVVVSRSCLVLLLLLLLSEYRLFCRIFVF